MPSKKPEVPKESGDIILRLGKGNNVIAWSEQVKTVVGADYGLVSSFLSTNVRYFIPIPVEADYVPAFPPPQDGVAAHPPMTAAMTSSLRQAAYDRRSKRLEYQAIDEQKIYNVMWGRMSAASQSKVREEPGYEAAETRNDCVLLWELIRRTHLTHIFGVGDPLTVVNRKEQAP